MNVYLHENEVATTNQLKEKLHSPILSHNYLYFETSQSKENSNHQHTHSSQYCWCLADIHSSHACVLRDHQLQRPIASHGSEEPSRWLVMHGHRMLFGPMSNDGRFGGEIWGETLSLRKHQRSQGFFFFPMSLVFIIMHKQMQCLELLQSTCDCGGNRLVMTPTLRPAEWSHIKGLQPLT